MSATLLVFDEGGGEAPVEEGIVQLEELRQFEVRVTDGRPGDVVELDALPLDAGATGWRVAVGQWTTSSPLVLRVVREGTAVARMRVRVIPRREKLPEALWMALLEELERDLPGVVVGLTGGRVGAVDRSGVDAPWIVEALAPLVPALLRAAKIVLDDPRRVTHASHVEVPLHQVRRADRDVLRWVARKTDVAMALDGWAALGMREPTVLQERAHDDLDHPANRAVVWWLRQIAARLDDTAKALGQLSDRAERSQDDDAAAWCRGRSHRMEAAARAVIALLRGSSLARVVPAPPTEAAMLVVGDDPSYARLHGIARRFLSPLFALEGDGEFGAAARPTYELYEVWCFLEVQRQLAAALPDWSWSQNGMNTLLRLSGTVGEPVFAATNPDGSRIEIEFNQTFPALFHRRGDRGYSVTSERRPDVVIRAWGPRLAGWLCLDAKWRVGRHNLGEAFTSAHVYRDALRDEDHGGRPRAVLLLAPSRTADAAEWFTERFRNEEGCGAWELRPSEQRSLDLGHWIVAILAAR